ncbi:ABC transporter permease [Methylobrevis pamukkalensis]|uniref:Branched-chain amino acid transport system / permease component n=1 Tax=Methylobrevis pamukkalensis TaxID=1439726 RepID=A0A1E3H5N6_9HYPH|nr:ABC transporter permease [Methylobrevis pamukkalensis]ODN71116.1 Branched-chain amino acid transport system / permease component [Methylobrevis pamukkalensis]
MADARFPLAIRPRPEAGPLARLAAVLGGLVLGLAISVALLVGAGVEPSALLDEFVLVFLASPQSAASVLFQAEPLMFTGLAALLAFRARFWNIGIEGQMIAGAIIATAITLLPGIPDPLRLPVMALGAAIGGMAWIALPALLRLRLGVNEIITTLLLNYVALNGLLWLLYGPWKDPVSGFPYSAEYTAAERLPSLGWGRVDLALPLAILIALAIAFLLARSRFGFLLRFVEANPAASGALGIDVTKVVLTAVLASGALAGLAGFVVSAGVEYRMTQSFFVGYGFSGILIAFLARNRPILALVVALLVGLLMVGGQSMQVFYQIPGSMVQLIQAVLVITVAASDFFVGHRIVLQRAEAAG